MTLARQEAPLFRLLAHMPPPRLPPGDGFPRRREFDLGPDIRDPKRVQSERGGCYHSCRCSIFNQSNRRPGANARAYDGTRLTTARAKCRVRTNNFRRSASRHAPLFLSLFRRTFQRGVDHGCPDAFDWL